MVNTCKLSLLALFSVLFGSASLLAMNGANENEGGDKADMAPRKLLHPGLHKEESSEADKLIEEIFLMSSSLNKNQRKQLAQLMTAHDLNQPNALTLEAIRALFERYKTENAP